MAVLVEDVVQQNLVRRFLERCGHDLRACRFLPLPAGRGCGEKHVRDQYPAQVRACRSSLGKKTSALLVVMIDADKETVAQRHRQLDRELEKAGAQGREAVEPIAVLVPKRHIETWIRALLGEVVDEDTDYTAPVPRPEQIALAARTLHTLTRPSAALSAMPASLAVSIPEWQRIP